MDQTESHNKVIDHLNELIILIEKGFNDKAWDSMDEANKEMLLILKQLNKEQLKTPEISSYLQSIQEKFNIWIAACNKYKDQVSNELLLHNQKERGICTYQSTNDLRGR
ncbi:MAG: hypothetical protein PUP46_02545 [Endozoicomonas sp. (ex Botrylloides leachii)]|nr:hypothetical protein [Endozoicomonas sp. (ex Botrylloides leachii)]